MCIRDRHRGVRLFQVSFGLHTLGEYQCCLLYTSASTSKGGPENSGYAPEIASNCLDGRSNLRRFAGIRHVRGRLDATGLQVGDSVGEPISASSDQGQRVALAPESLCGRLRYSWTITKDNQYTRNRSYLQLALNRQTTSLRFSAPCCDHELDGPT